MAIVAFTGGGSGGHVIPGIAVVDELRERRAHTIVWFGSRQGIERSIVESMAPDVRYVAVPTGKLRRYISLRNLVDAFKVPVGVVFSLCVLVRLRPSVLFSKGGFVSVPPVIAAWLLRIPVVTHESDLDPGLATFINARFARTICVAYDSTVAAFGEKIRERVVVTGNPVRRDLRAGNRTTADRLFSLDGERPVVLVLGGSLGSESLNRAIDRTLDRLTEFATIVHHRGRGNVPPNEPSDYRWAEFFGEEYPHLLARADLVVCRAGAGMLWELASTGTPSILIPLGDTASRGDQLRNARLYSETGAAVVMQEDMLIDEDFVTTVRSLIEDEERRQRMAAAACGFANDDAAVHIITILESLMSA